MTTPSSGTSWPPLTAAAAGTAVTLGPDKELAAARQLGDAAGGLLEVAGARKRKLTQARIRFEKELGKFRAAVQYHPAGELLCPPADAPTYLLREVRSERQKPQTLIGSGAFVWALTLREVRTSSRP